MTGAHKKENPVIVGLDIGTTKIAAIVSQRDQHGKLQILGLGKTPSYGVTRGEVTNIKQTTDAILEAVAEAEKQSGHKIDVVYVGIAGQHIASKQNRGIYTLPNAEEEITRQHIKDMVEDMHRLALDPGERIIHVLPQEFTVDNMHGIKDPIGMCGSRLEANFHIITGKVAAAQNIKKCVERSGLQMLGLILEPLASSAAVLHADEMEAGVVLVDIGGGTTDVASEVAEAAKFLRDAEQRGCDTVIVRSNHDEALIRWLKEADFREDPENALFHLDTNAAAYRAMAAGELFDAIEHVLRKAGAPAKTIFLKRDEQYVVCEDAGGGIELGMHGDIGVNGSRGTLQQFARTGRKCVVGHTHVAGITEGAYQVGVMGALDMGYNEGQSSWSHSSVVIYPNGKRAVLTIWKGRWRG